MLYKIGVNSKHKGRIHLFASPGWPTKPTLWSLHRRESQPFRKGENSVSQKFVSPLLTWGWEGVGHNSSTVVTLISVGHCQLKAASLDSTNFACVSHNNTPIPPPFFACVD